MQCREHDTADWFNITDSDIQVNYLYQQPRGILNTTTYSECVYLCQEEVDTCAVILKENGCLWYESSSTYSSSGLSARSEVTAMLKLCPAGKYSMQGCLCYIFSFFRYVVCLSTVFVFCLGSSPSHYINTGNK